MSSNAPEEVTLPTKDQSQPEKKQSQASDTGSEQGNHKRQKRSDSEEDGQESGEVREEEEEGENTQKDQSPPPLPNEEVPPLPNEPVPGTAEDDGWDAMWDDNVQAYYFYNRFTGISQWENPRIPEPETQQQPGPPGVSKDLVSSGDKKGEGGRTQQQQENSHPRAADGYDPAIHGDYDPTAWYAQQTQDGTSAAPPISGSTPADPNMIYTATGTFNRFTGKWQAADLEPENFNDENKTRRQMNAYFDVDAAANSHEGRSLKAERSGKKLTKKELKAFKDKRRERKEEKRRAWLRD